MGARECVHPAEHQASRGVLASVLEPPWCHGYTMMYGQVTRRPLSTAPLGGPQSSAALGANVCYAENKGFSGQTYLIKGLINGFPHCKRPLTC